MNGLLAELMKRIALARSPQPALEKQLGPITPAAMPMGPPESALAKLFKTGGTSPTGELGRIPGTEWVGTQLRHSTQPSLGTMNPEFTAVGDEAAFNASRPVPMVPNPIESTYTSILKKGGR
jgi:hypothetical protein